MSNGGRGNTSLPLRSNLDSDPMPASIQDNVSRVRRGYQWTISTLHLYYGPLMTSSSLQQSKSLPAVAHQHWGTEASRCCPATSIALHFIKGVMQTFRN